MIGPFIPSDDLWVRSHFYDVPNETAAFCENLAGATILDVGCGEMLTDFGMLAHNVKHVTGLDTRPVLAWEGLGLNQAPFRYVEAVAQKLESYRIDFPPDYPSRPTYNLYDGARFPFEDRSFDFIFSWSAFEHVANVPEVLSEIRRVLTDDGRAFIQVYPWYPSFAGSHLSDYIQEPYFHLKHDADWVREALDKYRAAHPDNAQFVNYMFSEYLTLNRYSADRFYRDIMQAGFNVVKSRMISFDLDLSGAPPDTDFSSLMICGTKMLLTKNLDFVPKPPAPAKISLDELTQIAEDRAKQIDDLRRSLSWRITAPLRAAGGLVSRVLRKK